MNAAIHSPGRLLGHTLVELLIAMTIGSLLILLLSSLVSSSSDVWGSVNDRQDVTVEAKAALEIIQSDLQAALLHGFPDRSECFRISRFPDLEGPDSNKTTHADWLLFFTASQDRDEGDPGVTSAVSYRLVYRDALSTTHGTSPRFFLYRVLVNPETSFKEILNQESLTESYWTRESATRRGHIIASDIVDFHITPLLVDPQGRVFRAPSDANFRLWGKTVELEGENAGPPIAPGTKIHSFEITLTVISPTGRARLEDQVPLQEVVNRHGRKFSQFVTLY